MATFISDLLPDLDDIRTLAGELGMRVFTVSLVIRTYTGTRVGFGTMTESTTTFQNSSAYGGGQPVRVMQISRKEAIASGGLYTDRDLRVGPLTRPYPGGGYEDVLVDPTPSGRPTECIWTVSGPAIPQGACFTKIGEEATSMHTFVILRQTGRTL